MRRELRDPEEEEEEVEEVEGKWVPPSGEGISPRTVQRGDPRKITTDNNTLKTWVIILSQNKVVIMTVAAANGCSCSSVGLRWGCGAKDPAFCGGWQTAGRYVTDIFRIGVCVFPNGLLLPYNSPSMSLFTTEVLRRIRMLTIPDSSWYCILWAVIVISEPAFVFTRNMIDH